jgi:hypothetical protein
VDNVVITLDHDSKLTCTEFEQVLSFFFDHNDDTLVRMEIVYKTPVPEEIVYGIVRGFAAVESVLAAHFGDKGLGTGPPAFSLRALGEAAFATHLRNLV